MRPDRGKTRPLAAAAATVATAAALLVLDLAWLGVVARDLYREALGGLMRPEAYLPAAALFYAFYVSVTVAWAVLGAPSTAGAARRGGLAFAPHSW